MKKSLILTACILTMATSLVRAEDAINMIIGDLEAIPVKNLSRVSVTDPEIADIADAQAENISVLGKSAGQTVVFLWDDMGKRSVVVRVTSQDMSTTKTRIGKILKAAGINGVALEENAYEGKIVLSGSVNKEDKESLDTLLEPYSDQTINLVKEGISEELVQIDMQIVELNTSETKNLGISWENTTDGVTLDSLQLQYPETLPKTDGSIRDYFKIGDFNRTSPLVPKVNALIVEGKARLLSKPRIVSVSGKEASFLVGGEIPIISTSLSTTGNTITQNTSFKEYGVNLTVTPTVKKEKIDVLLNVEIRDIDGSKQSGNDTAFLTRTAQTTLLLDDGQTIVLAGLIKRSDSQKVRSVPFVSKIPIVGLLFRNRSTPTPNSDTELVIILTPTVLKSKKYAQDQTVMPTPRLRSIADELESGYETEPLGGRDVPRPIEIPRPVEMPKPTMVPVALPVQTTPYTVQIQQKISQAISYPYEALENGWQGTVKLRLHILRDGTLATATVTESSGHDVFDKDALNTAKIVAPYPTFTSEMSQEDLIVTIPIVYSQGALSRYRNQDPSSIN